MSQNVRSLDLALPFAECPPCPKCHGPMTLTNVTLAPDGDARTFECVICNCTEKVTKIKNGDQHNTNHKRHEQKCARCDSKLVNVEWDERVNAGQMQYLWRCLNCKHEFIIHVASYEKPTSDAEITEPFFSSLVVE